MYTLLSTEEPAKEVCDRKAQNKDFFESKINCDYTCIFLSTSINICCTQKNPLIETILLSTRNNMFWLRNDFF